MESLENEGEENGNIKVKFSSDNEANNRSKSPTKSVSTKEDSNTKGGERTKPRRTLNRAKSATGPRPVNSNEDYDSDDVIQDDSQLNQGSSDKGMRSFERAVSPSERGTRTNAKFSQQRMSEMNMANWSDIVVRCENEEELDSSVPRSPRSKGWVEGIYIYYILYCK
jgi:hypothetical protein